jgi:hypothetical protein
MDEKMIWLSTWRHFLLGEFSVGQVSWAASNPLTINLTSKDLQLEGFLFFCFSHLVYHTNRCLI